MKKRLAFVFGGGGARGAMQVGALQALLEARIEPDLLVGTSAGAVNASFLALRGLTSQALDDLAKAWKDAAVVELLPPNYLWLTVRALFKRPDRHTEHRMRNFFISHGVSPEIRFQDVRGARLVLVAADLNSGQPVLFGEELQQSVLEGLLASTAIPPWVSPMQKDGQMLIDGGLVSALPIEPAISLGAEQIIALDLADPRLAEQEAEGFGPFLTRVLTTVAKRQAQLELALAAAHNVQVLHIPLSSEEPIPVWDFQFCDELIAQGYALTRQALSNWQEDQYSGWSGFSQRLIRLFSATRSRLQGLFN